jgi:hypothetical protein
MVAPREELEMNAVALRQNYHREGAVTPPPVGADLPVALAVLDPSVFLVRERERDGGGTSLMRREADGCWYFID